jgi:hypothetical protein
MLAGFVGFTALGVWWAAPSGPTLARTLRELGELGPVNAVILAALALALLWVEVVRLIVFGRVLGVPVGARAGFDAAIANDLFSWISPGGFLGEPAVIFMMARRGVPWDAALAISFGKFATSFALFMGGAGVLVALGYGPSVAGWAVGSVVAAIGFGVLLIGAFVAGALRPGPALRLVARFENRGRVIAASARIARRSIERLSRFRDASALGWIAMLGSHVLYYGSYVALLVVLGHLFGARSVGELIPLAIIYQAFTYIAPAPGIPEAGAIAFFGGVLSEGDAFVVVLLFRALTAYFQVALALIYLPVIGALRSILERRTPEGV